MRQRGELPRGGGTAGASARELPRGGGTAGASARELPRGGGTAGASARELRAAIAGRVEQVLGRAPAPGGLTVEDIVTVVLALSNGLAIELYADPGAVSDGLFGRVLAQLSREARPWACDG